jgi:hypothetical protein
MPPEQRPPEPDPAKVDLCPVGSNFLIREDDDSFLGHAGVCEQCRAAWLQMLDGDAD